MSKEFVEVRMQFDKDSGELEEVKLVSGGKDKTKMIKAKNPKGVSVGKGQPGVLDLSKFQETPNIFRPHTFFFSHGSPG